MKSNASKSKFGITPNEIFGYSSAFLFFLFALMIYFNMFLPGQFMEYRFVLTVILVLYGIFRFLITRSKATTKKRLENIITHREELEKKQFSEEEK